MPIAEDSAGGSPVPIPTNLTTNLTGEATGSGTLDYTTGDIDIAVTVVDNGHNHILSNITDVQVNNAISGQILVYNGTVWANATNTAGITALVQDTSPALGGNLDLNNRNITGTGNIAITGTIDGRDVSADGTKLDGIESGATADQTAAQIKTAYESNANTNNFADADVSKLSGIEPGATTDQTAAQIKTAYESNSNTNAFTDADHTKLDGIETAADVTDTTNVVASLTAGTNVTIAADGTISATGGTSGIAHVVDDTTPELGGNLSLNSHDITGTGNLNFTGNLTLSGTVDGRDVAADGTKLDGIEAGATADQTAAEILTAIKTVDGSGSGLDADTVDGLQVHTAVNNQANQIVRTNGSGYALMGWINTTSGVTSSTITRMYMGQDDGYIRYMSPTNFFNQQASALLTAIKTVDGSGSGLDADTLDGVQGSNFLRSDTTDYMNANLVFADNARLQIGTNTDLQLYHDGSHSYIKEAGTGNLNILGDDIRFLNSANNNALMYLTNDEITFHGHSHRPDNTYSQFGTGNDLQIYHSGANSWIRDVGTGALFLDTNTAIHLYANGSENMLYAQPNAGVQVFYDNVKKLETTSNGIQVTNASNISMDGSANGHFKVQGSGYGFAIALDADAANLYTNSSSRDLVFGVNETEVARVTPAGLDVTGTTKTSGSGYNPNNTGWATNAALITTGAYGGGLTLVDGSEGYSIRAENFGADLVIGHGATSGALSTKLTVTSSGIDVTGALKLNLLTTTPTWDTNTRHWTEAGFGARYDSYQHRFDVGTSRTEAMRINQVGHLGIGTTSPQHPLDVVGNIRIGHSSGYGYVQYGSDSTSTDNWHVGSEGDGSFRFYNGALGAGSEKLRVDSNGNFGVGTTAPKAKTQVTSGGYATPTLGSVPSGASLYVSPADTAYGLVVGMDNVAPRTWLQSQHTNGASVAYTLTLQEAGGNVGIGTANATAKLSVAGGVTVSTNLNVGNATPAGGGTIESHVQSSSTPALITYSGSSSLRTHISFENFNGQVGKINTAGTQTFYVTSSDYRLKTDIQPMQGSIDRVKALNPCNFEWVNDGGRVDGFIAHEMQEVIPEAIVGEKDAMQDQKYVQSEATGDIYTPAVKATYETIQVELTPAVDAVYETVTVEISPAVDATYDDEGNELTPAIEAITEEQEQLVTPAVEATYEEQQQELTPAIDEVIHSSDVVEPDELEEGQEWRETTEKVMATRQVPDYQGIDQSKIVPLLTSALQDAIAKIEALETRLTALES